MMMIQYRRKNGSQNHHGFALFLKKIFVYLSMTLEIRSFGFNMIISVSGDYGDYLGDAGGP